MIANSLISKIIAPLTLQDKGMYALDQMSEYRLRHLPIVDKGILLGLISEEEILNHDLESSFANYEISHNQLSISEKKHIYEIVRLMADFNLTAIPITNEDRKYLGIVTQESVLTALGNTGSFTLPGSVIMLEMNKKDYSLSHISGVIERENATVVGTLISSNDLTNMAEVTLKINKKDVSRIVAALERYGYHVKASYHSSPFSNDSLQERFDSFMMYLNV